ncbi:hypothetical protein TNCV_4896161 [Trichonephila clavipes]|uniref:Uncharacterized protein n=1 Tax=Trichonephila clavipes TaxID=2585209 RepID=A0A8X6VWZ9_TRICX|nr:hypothetical protein TNCV_4896161 [Trichonephila clavipes]
MGDCTYAENAAMHYLYAPANGNGRGELRMYHAQFLDRRIQDQTESFSSYTVNFVKHVPFTHVTRHDAGRRRGIPSSRLEESILDVVVDRPESSRRTVA